MHGRLLLLSAGLLSCCVSSGEASWDSASAKIVASAGEAVILPCRTSVEDDLPTVEWAKEGLAPNIAFLYRDGSETHEMKNQVFWYRTNLLMNELYNGNISLRISNVQLSDAGKYRCKTIRRKVQKDVTVELFVGAVSEPKLSFVENEAGERLVRLQCEANCWFPQPDITFFDDERNKISAEDPKSSQDSRGCFTVTRRLTVPTGTKRVHCRVHQHATNQTRVTETYIPDIYTVPYVLVIIIVIAVVVIILLCGLLIRKEFCSYVGTQKSQASMQSSHLPDNTNNANPEQQKLINDLKSNLAEKENIIRQKTEQLNDLRSKLSPAVCQHGQPLLVNSPSESSQDVSKPTDPPPHQVPLSPKPAASTSSNPLKPGNILKNKDSKHGVPRRSPAPLDPLMRSGHNHSCPALLTDNADVSPSAAPSFTPGQSQVHRTMSLSDSRPRPSIAKPQRRHTTSAQHANRFSVLANLPEDSEPLL